MRIRKHVQDTCSLCFDKHIACQWMVVGVIGQNGVIALLLVEMGRNGETVSAMIRHRRMVDLNVLVIRMKLNFATIFLARVTLRNTKNTILSKIYKYNFAFCTNIFLNITTPYPCVQSMEIGAIGPTGAIALFPAAMEAFGDGATAPTHLHNLAAHFATVRRMRRKFAKHSHVQVTSCSFYCFITSVQLFNFIYSSHFEI